MSQFIGKGEKEVLWVLRSLFPAAQFETQVPIVKLVRYQDYILLDEEISKHKHDIVMHIGLHTLVIEVNYKHKEKAAKKWSNIFTKLLVDNGKTPVTIDDYNCEFLFSDSEQLKKKNPWGSYIDVIRELSRQGITPNGSML